MAAEKLTPSHERHEQKEVAPVSVENAEQKPEKSHESRHKTPEKHNTQEIRGHIEKEAVSREELKIDKKNETSERQHHYVSADLRKDTLNRSLKKVRRHLAAPEKVFSKAIHSPLIDAVSKAGANTIARPNGVLTGSVLALAGSSYVLYSAKRYGYEYNFAVVLLLFAGGYAAGLIIELLIYLIKRPKRRV